MGFQYTLSVKNGPEAGKIFILERNELMLGREMVNDLVVNDPEVSRKHAVLRKIGTQYLIEDLGSTNGTFLLGNRISMPMMLQNGDEITIGERVVLRYEIKQLDPDATTVSPRVHTFNPSEPAAVSAPIEAPVAAPAPVIVPAAAPTPAAPPESAARQTVEPVIVRQSVAQQPAPAPIQEPPVQVQPAVAIPPVPVKAPPAYAGKTPAQPVKTRKQSSLKMILLIILAVVLVFCVIPWIIIDITNSYCLFLPGVFNAIQPGVCP